MAQRQPVASADGGELMQQQQQQAADAEALLAQIERLSTHLADSQHTIQSNSLRRSDTMFALIAAAAARCAVHSSECFAVHWLC